ncbi:MAG: DUF4352 domain-containing protein [Bulleidia sp.]|nr:DUF4352 domain-containing protein [Bulleidia sp.]
MSNKRKGIRKNCQYCKTTIPSDAKICPYCGKKQNRTQKRFLTLLILVAVLFCGGIVLKEKYGSKGIGDTVNCDGIKVKLQDAFLCETNAFFGKDEGKEYLALIFDIENTTSADTYISSTDFSAYCDEYAVNEYMLSVLLPQLDQLNHLHGDLASGKKIKGYIVYEIPGDFKKVEIRYSSVFDYKNSESFTLTRKKVLSSANH